MRFWMKKMALGLVLAITAYLLLANQEFLAAIIKALSSDSPETAKQTTTIEQKQDPAASTLPATQKSTPASDIETKKEPAKKVNAAAEGLSRFYASINPSMTGKQPRIRENIVYLPEPNDDLVGVLQARKKVISPLPKHWRSPTEPRPFRQGETLYQKLSEYAHNEGLEVMWYLNRDFLIKDAFRIDKDILITSYQIGKAIEGHFENGVNIYFCYQHRSIVLIDKKEDYLNKECRKLTSNRK